MKLIHVKIFALKLNFAESPARRWPQFPAHLLLQHDKLVKIVLIRINFLIN